MTYAIESVAVTVKPAPSRNLAVTVTGPQGCFTGNANSCWAAKSIASVQVAPSSKLNRIRTFEPKLWAARVRLSVGLEVESAPSLMTTDARGSWEGVTLTAGAETLWAGPLLASRSVTASAASVSTTLPSVGELLRNVTTYAASAPLT